MRVTAAGVNPIDWKSARARRSAIPFVLGQDFAGVVSETGDRVTKYREGERIFGISARGAFLRRVHVAPEDDPSAAVAKIPDSVGDADAAALPTAGLTALAGVEALHVGKERRCSFLARPAASAASPCRSRTIAARTSSAPRTPQTKSGRVSLGVDEFVAYDREDVVAAVKAAHPGGIDAVLDLVDNADAIKAMARGAARRRSRSFRRSGPPT